MLITSHKRLKEFWERPGCRDAEEALAAWHSIGELADWKTWADVRATYNTASVVGHCVVFNICGNKYRLVTRIIYAKHRVYILKVMTHKEYDDQEKWQHDCGCHEPPPAHPAQSLSKGNTAPRRRQHRR